MRDLAGLTTTVEVKDDTGRVVGKKEVILYRTLLDLAHSEKLTGIKTEMLQAPSAENGLVCIFSAEVITEKGVFVAIGDASPTSVDAVVAQHYIRAAETRAKARALRDALNIGVVAFEEIYGNGFDQTDPQGQERKKASRAQKTQKDAHKEEKNHSEKSSNGEDALITEAQRKFIFRLLADQGIEGNDALESILSETGADSIKSVTRKQASELIGKLKGEE